MIKYVNDLSSSSDIAADHTNYGFGAKVAAAIMNKLGIQYEAWKNGQGYMVKFYYDEKEKSYGLHQFNTEGENKFYVPMIAIPSSYSKTLEKELIKIKLEEKNSFMRFGIGKKNLVIKFLINLKN